MKISHVLAICFALTVFLFSDQPKHILILIGPVILMCYIAFVAGMHKTKKLLKIQPDIVYRFYCRAEKGHLFLANPKGEDGMYESSFTGRNGVCRGLIVDERLKTGDPCTIEHINVNLMPKLVPPYWTVAEKE